MMKGQQCDDVLRNCQDFTTSLDGRGISGTMWKYEQLRAGKVYTKFMFNTREEAESFATQMSKAEPDLFCRIEPVAASAVWN